MLHFLSLLIAFVITHTLAQEEDLDLIPCMGKGRGRNSTDLRAQFDEDILPRSRIGVRSIVYQVETYVHVITTIEKKDSYPRSMVQKQIDVMNTAYAGSFHFNLQEVDFTIHDVWATENTDENEEAYKTVLRKGSYADLNLYFLSDLGKAENSTLLGFCYMPESDPDSQELLLNGCTNLASTMPGGGSKRFGMGMTSVHEVGHWLGLYHTFEGESCQGSGDYVSDTPMQALQTDGCPVLKDSCPGKEGLDSIHNYMDYSDDRCLSEFTPGQISRMLHSYGNFRYGK